MKCPNCENELVMQLDKLSNRRHTRKLCPVCNYHKGEIKVEKKPEKKTSIDLGKLLKDALPKKLKAVVDEKLIDNEKIIFSNPLDEYRVSFIVSEKHDFGKLIEAVRNLQIDTKDGFELCGCMQRDKSPLRDTSKVHYRFDYHPRFSEGYKNKLLQEV